MDFKDESFDLIICNHVLEHIEDDKSALNEIYRVLKYNGISFLQVPINLKREKTFEDPSIKSKISKTEFMRPASDFKSIICKCLFINF